MNQINQRVPNVHSEAVVCHSDPLLLKIDVEHRFVGDGQFALFLMSQDRHPARPQHRVLVPHQLDSGQIWLKGGRQGQRERRGKERRGEERRRSIPLYNVDPMVQIHFHLYICSSSLDYNIYLCILKGLFRVPNHCLWISAVCPFILLTFNESVDLG